MTIGGRDNSNYLASENKVVDPNNLAKEIKVVATKAATEAMSVFNSGLEAGNSAIKVAKASGDVVKTALETATSLIHDSTSTSRDIISLLRATLEMTKIMINSLPVTDVFGLITLPVKLFFRFMKRSMDRRDLIHENGLQIQNMVYEKTRESEIESLSMKKILEEEIKKTRMMKKIIEERRKQAEQLKNLTGEQKKERDELIGVLKAAEGLLEETENKVEEAGYEEKQNPEQKQDEIKQIQEILAQEGGRKTKRRKTKRRKTKRRKTKRRIRNKTKKRI
jgi:hypothetical protein